MLKNHLKIALRHLYRDQPFSLLNLLGLAIGMAACLSIFLLVRYEWSYDQQSPHAADIWRVYCASISNEGEPTLDANTHSAIGPALNDALAEVIEHTRLYNRNEDEVIFLQDNQPLKISDVWMVDPGYLKMFPQEFLAGDVSTCLEEPYSMVITQSTAQRLLPGGIASIDHYIGQTLEVPAGVFQGIYTIKGIIADPPQNTHLRFNILASYATRYAKGHQDNWNNYWGYTYFQTRPDADINPVEQQLSRFSDQHLEDNGLRLHLQPLTDIHLHSALTYEIEANGNARMVNFLAIIGLFILFIAFFNYVNLMTARALNRAGEVGIRKVVGATRGQLIRQFITEGFLLNFIALSLALLALPSILAGLEKLSGRPLTSQLRPDGYLLLMIAGILILSILISCLYPALTLSRYKPIQILKGPLTEGRSRFPLRKGIVVFQFTCSTLLIISVIIVNQQLTYLRQYDLGLSIDQKLAIKMPTLDFRNDTTAFSRFTAFRDEVEQLSGVIDLTAAEALPGLGISSISGGSGGLHWVDQPAASTQAATYYLNISPDFFESFDIPLRAGELFEVNSREDIFNNVIINDAARKMLGFPDQQSAIDEAISFDRNPGRQMRIRAVVDNFHIESLKAAPRPTLYHLDPRIVNGYFALQIRPEDISLTMEQIQSFWAKSFPITPLEYWFIDENFHKQYREEEQLSNIFRLFTSLAIFIACLGLLGLSIYDTRQRTREISIRKVLGASAMHIIRLLNKDVLWLVIIAILLAAPLSYYIMHRWLSGFAYQINIQWWVFVLSALVMLILSTLATSYQILKAAFSNPADSLKHE